MDKHTTPLERGDATGRIFQPKDVIAVHHVIDRLELNEFGQAVIHSSRIGLTFWTRDFVVVGKSVVVSWDALILSLSQAGYIPARWELNRQN